MKDTIFVYNNGVNKRFIRGLLIVLMAMLQLVNLGVAFAQGDGWRYFPTTGHWLTGEFLEKYESIPNPEIVYGDPITDAFDSQLSQDPAGTQIQYFERARFELHPDYPEDLRVTLTLVGEFFYDRDGPGKPLSTKFMSPACQNIPKDGPQVCFAFLQFFNDQGGIAQFGYPISEMVILNGRLVQYFQRARLEWRPERPSGHRVYLTDLGSLYFDAVDEDVLLKHPHQDAVPSELMELKVNVFVDHAVMPPNGLQEVYVIVQDQTLQPVSGAHVVIHIYLPSGGKQDFSMPLTNSNGLAEVSFIVQDQPAGLVHIVVEARSNELHVTTETCFRIWK